MDKEASPSPFCFAIWSPEKAVVGPKDSSYLGFNFGPKDSSYLGFNQN